MWTKEATGQKQMDGWSGGGGVKKHSSRHSFSTPSHFLVMMAVVVVMAVCKIKTSFTHTNTKIKQKINKKSICKQEYKLKKQISTREVI